ncbi:thiol:disulfide interchange protein DsbA [Podila verticillata NRRL 6337]|nr:thiol:disulfide interchange protein DsbA [Podila verticillata NRRL 6337]
MVISALVLLMACAYASPSSPEAGVDYQVISTSAPSYVPAGKIEVLDFFWYASPQDYALEPKLAAWAKSQNPDVIFKRVPVAFNANFAPQQRLFHALDTLGYADQLALKIFEEIQVKRNNLLTPQAQANFVAEQGVDRQKFLSAYNSFANAAGVRQDNRLVNQYLIQSVPSFVVQGQYKTSVALTQSIEGTIAVLDFLVSKARLETVQAQ